MKISVAQGALVVNGRRGMAVRIADITEVTVEKVGKITYDELFLIVREQSGNAISLGELDEGFSNAEQALLAYLPGFPADWRIAAEEAPIGVQNPVWAAPS